LKENFALVTHLILNVKICVTSTLGMILIDLSIGLSLVENNCAIISRKSKQRVARCMQH